jgi:hypothetical protein
MSNNEPAFPFYVSTEVRALSAVERSIVLRLVPEKAPDFTRQLDQLVVVGRCGCGICPTVFFQHHDAESRERQVASYMGRDSSGGEVGAVLFENDGQLSQLEFYSVDGHEPYGPPEPASLRPC